jgi:hypothetical protein
MRGYEANNDNKLAHLNASLKNKNIKVFISVLNKLSNMS